MRPLLTTLMTLSASAVLAQEPALAQAPTRTPEVFAAPDRPPAPPPSPPPRPPPRIG